MSFPVPNTSLAPIEDILMDTLTAQAVIDSVRMKLFDHLATAPMDTEALATKMGLQPKPLEALLDLLVYRDILEIDGATYTNTAMTAEYLVSTSPLYQGKALEMQHRHNETMTAGLEPLLRGEKPQRKQTDQMWAEYDAMAGTMQHTLNGQIQLATEFICSLPEFPSFGTMADVGGSHGQYSLELLMRNPKLESTLYDLPHVVPVSEQWCHSRNLPDELVQRMSFAPLDIREGRLPEDKYDFIFTSHILYGVNDQLETFLSGVYASLHKGGCFASHHLAPEGGASDHYKKNVQLMTRLMGYDTHFMSRERLESALKNAGFGDFSHTFTGMDGQTLLLVARKQ